jgi:hypothetical protein
MAILYELLAGSERPRAGGRSAGVPEDVPAEPPTIGQPA